MLNTDAANLKRNLSEMIDKSNPCWNGYEMIGTKEKNGKEVPNCVKKSDNPTNGTIKPSTRSTKTHMVFMDGEWHHFGDPNLKTNKSEKQAYAATARHARHLKGNNARAKAYRVYWRKTWSKAPSLSEIKKSLPEINILNEFDSFIQDEFVDNITTADLDKSIVNDLAGEFRSEFFQKGRKGLPVGTERKRGGKTYVKTSDTKNPWKLKGKSKQSEPNQEKEPSDTKNESLESAVKGLKGFAKLNKMLEIVSDKHNLQVFPHHDRIFLVKPGLKLPSTEDKFQYLHDMHELENKGDAIHVNETAVSKVKEFENLAERFGKKVNPTEKDNIVEEYKKYLNKNKKSNLSKEEKEAIIADFKKFRGDKTESKKESPKPAENKPKKKETRGRKAMPDGTRVTRANGEFIKENGKWKRISSKKPKEEKIESKKEKPLESPKKPTESKESTPPKQFINKKGQKVFTFQFKSGKWRVSAYGKDGFDIKFDTAQEVNDYIAKNKQEDEEPKRIYSKKPKEDNKNPKQPVIDDAADKGWTDTEDYKKLEKVRKKLEKEYGKESEIYNPKDYKKFKRRLDQIYKKLKAEFEEKESKSFETAKTETKDNLIKKISPAETVKDYLSKNIKNNKDAAEFVNKNYRDAYKVNNASKGATGRTSSGDEKYGYLPNQVEFMETSDLTGKKIRHFLQVDIKGKTYIFHPDEIRGGNSEIKKQMSVLEIASKNQEKAKESILKDSVLSFVYNKIIDIVSSYNQFELFSKLKGNDYFNYIRQKDKSGDSVVISADNFVKRVVLSEIDNKDIVEKVKKIPEQDLSKLFTSDLAEGNRINKEEILKEELPDGTIRVWKDGEYEKINGKWVRRKKNTTSKNITPKEKAQIKNILRDHNSALKRVSKDNPKNLVILDTENAIRAILGAEHPQLPKILSAIPKEPVEPKKRSKKPVYEPTNSSLKNAMNTFKETVADLKDLNLPKNQKRDIVESYARAATTSLKNNDKEAYNKMINDFPANSPEKSFLKLISASNANFKKEQTEPNLDLSFNLERVSNLLVSLNSAIKINSNKNSTLAKLENAKKILPAKVYEKLKDQISGKGRKTPLNSLKIRDWYFNEKLKDQLKGGLSKDNAKEVDNTLNALGLRANDSKKLDKLSELTDLPKDQIKTLIQDLRKTPPLTTAQKTQIKTSIRDYKENLIDSNDPKRDQAIIDTTESNITSILGSKHPDLKKILGNLPSPEEVTREYLNLPESFRGLPNGTVRQWKDGEYEKINGKWVRKKKPKKEVIGDQTKGLKLKIIQQKASSLAQASDPEISLSNNTVTIKNYYTTSPLSEKDLALEAARFIALNHDDVFDKLEDERGNLKIGNFKYNGDNDKIIGEEKKQVSDDNLVLKNSSLKQLQTIFNTNVSQLNGRDTAIRRETRDILNAIHFSNNYEEAKKKMNQLKEFNSISFDKKDNWNGASIMGAMYPGLKEFTESSYNAVKQDLSVGRWTIAGSNFPDPNKDFSKFHLKAGDSYQIPHIYGSQDIKLTKGEIRDFEKAMKFLSNYNSLEEIKAAYADKNYLGKKPVLPRAVLEMLHAHHYKPQTDYKDNKLKVMRLIEDYKKGVFDDMIGSAAAVKQVSVYVTKPSVKFDSDGNIDGASDKKLQRIRLEDEKNKAARAAKKAEEEEIAKKMAEMQKPENLRKTEYYNDISEQEARQAYYWNSWSPDRRAEQEKLGWASMMLEDKKKFDNKSDFESYRKKALDYYKAYLSAKSRTASSAVTGPSNFPVRSNAKKLEYSRNAYTRFDDFRTKVLDRAFYDKNPSNAIKSTDERAIEKLQMKLQVLEDNQQRMKDYNKYVRSKEFKALTPQQRMIALKIDWPQFKALHGQASGLEKKEPWQTGDFRGYKMSNNNQEIKRIRDRIADVKRKKAVINEQQGKVFSVGQNTAQIGNTAKGDRTIVEFPSRVSKELYRELKSNGFRYSRSTGQFWASPTSKYLGRAKTILSKYKDNWSE